MKIKRYIFIFTVVFTLLFLLAGVSYLGFTEFKKFKTTETSKQKQAEAALEQQRLALEASQKELQKIQEQNKSVSEQTGAEIQKLKSEVNAVQEQSQPNNISITSAELKPYLNGVANIKCGNSSGSGTFWDLKTEGYFFLTNFHVIEDSVRDSSYCLITAGDENSFVGAYSAYAPNWYSWNTDTDVAGLPLTKNSEQTSLKSASVNKLNYSISTLRECKTKADVGANVVVIGYPAFASKDLNYQGYKATQSTRTVTNGIISGYDTTVNRVYKTLPYPNYYVSAKIDSGNSGGIALSKDENGLCVLGIPTWLSVGNYETQGIIQNIHNILSEQ